MNNKILIEVIVPLLEMKYEVYVPINKRISTVINQIGGALKEMTNGYYPAEEGMVMIDQNTGNAYDVNITIKESKMLNGSKVVLI